MHEKEVLAGSVLEIESAGFEERRPFRPLTTLIDLRDCVRVAFESVPPRTHRVPDRMLQAVAARRLHMV